MSNSIVEKMDLENLKLDIETNYEITDFEPILDKLNLLLESTTGLLNTTHFLTFVILPIVLFVSISWVLLKRFM